MLPGASTINGGATLNNGAVTADAKLTLDTMTVSGTTITDNAGVEIDNTVKLTGGAIIQSGTITNKGTLEVSGLATLLNDTLNNATTGSILQIDSGDTLTLSGTTVSGGTITDNNVIHVTGASTINGGATLNDGAVTADAKLTLDTMTVSGTTITDNAGVEIDNTVKLTGGAIIQSGTITNKGTLEVSGLATLLNDTLNNATTGSILLIDSGDTLTLSGTTVSGGTITDNNIIHVTGAGTINGGATLNNGAVTADAKLTLDTMTVSGTTITDNAGVEIDNTVKLTGGAIIQSGTITNKGTLEVSGLATLLNDTLNNATTGSILQIDSGDTLTLSGTTVSGGTITDNNVIHVTGASTINGGATLNNGAVTADAKLTLDTMTVSGTTITDNAGVEIDNTVKLTGGAIIQSGTITNKGTLEVSGLATLLNDTLNNATTGSILQVDGGDTLYLSGTTVNGGNVTDNGIIEIIALSAIDGAILTGGGVTVDAAQTLTLDNTTVNGTVFTDTASGAILSVDSGDTLTLQNGATVNGGSLVNAGTVYIETTTGAALNGVNVVNSGGTIQVDLNPSPSVVTLTLGDGTTITDGKLSIGNSGEADVVSGATVTLDDVTVLNGDIANPLGLIQVDGTLNISGTSISGGTLTDNGTIDVSGTGNVFDHVTVDNAGLIEVLSGATLTVTGSIYGIGTVQIDSGATFELNGSDTQNIVFTGSGGELVIDGTGTFNVVDLATSDKLDLGAIDFSSNPTGTYVGDADSGTLTITDGTNSVTLDLSGDDYRNAHLAAESDGHGGTLITLKATDDAPVILAADKAESVDITELANTTGSSTTDPSPIASGSVQFSDIDLTDRPTASVGLESVTWTSADGQTDLYATLTPLEQAALDAELVSALALKQTGNTINGAIDWTYAIPDNQLDFLAAGEKLTATLTITVSDGEGGTDTSTVTVNITGANDAATIGDPTVASVTDGTNVDSNGNLVATGSISVVDPDHDQSSFQTTVTAADGDLGSLTLNADGTYTYTVANSAVEYLQQGESKTDSFTVTSLDGTTKWCRSRSSAPTRPRPSAIRQWRR